MLTNPVNDYINKTTLLNNILSNARAVDMSQRMQNGGVSEPRPAAEAKATPTQFKPGGAPFLPSRLAGSAGASAAQRQEAETYFRSLLTQYEETAQHDGFPANDVAYAMEYLLVNGYMIYHDLHEVPYEKDPTVKRTSDPLERLQLMAQKRARKPTLGEERAVFAQFQVALAAKPEMQKMSDQQKQELAELLAITLGMDLTAYLKALNAEDEAQIAQARASTKAHLETFFAMPIDAIKIGAKGLTQ